MDTSQYMPMFLAESRDHLQELNLAVLRIEEAPDDDETIDAIFRIAHSMKGMSATMGFGAMAELTHKMEDVFELLRQRRGGLSRDAVDAVLACLDTLEASVTAIDEHGEERLDPRALIERLDGLVRDRTAEQKAERLGGVSPDPLELIRLAAGREVVHVLARLADDVSMKSVRAFMVIGACGEHGDVVAALPDEEGLDTFAGDIVEVWVADADVAALTHAVATVAEVAEAVVTPVDIEALMVDLTAGGAEVAPTAVGEDTATTPPRGAARRTGGDGAKTVRVDAERLDQLMHAMAELVVHRTQLQALVAEAGQPGLAGAMQQLTRSSQALQSMVMQVRMIPVEAVFLRFPRLVRDLSGKLGKDIELVLRGQDTELDRTVVDALGDPLVHLIRNSIDHGLEAPEERVRAGKPATGRLEVSSRPTGGGVVITVRDDGCGIDHVKVAESALRRGLITAEEAAAIDPAGAVDLLFVPGFSTRDEADAVSGRGVGMDVVRSSIRALGGEVLMESVPGQGTVTEIRLPLSLAITSALLVEAGAGVFAIAIDRIERTVRVADWVIRGITGRPMLVLGDDVYPLVDAAALLTGTAPSHSSGAEHRYAVLVRSEEGRTIALGVDGLLGQQEMVCRSLPPHVGEDVALAAAAVLPSGVIALVVDVDALIRDHERGAHHAAAIPTEEAADAALHRTAA